MELERRCFIAELRTLRANDGPPKIVGHAAVFDQLSEDMGFREKIAPGAFKESIEQDDIRALWNHDSNFVLGRNKAGTLRMKEDDVGLAVEIDPPDTQAARDLMVSMERGDVSQMSFGFFTKTDKWEMVDGTDVRTLLEVELFDVSPVTFPAFPQTDVAVRSLEAFKASQVKRSVPIDLLARELDLISTLTPTR